MGLTAASLVASVTAPFGRLHRAAVDLGEEIGHALGHQVHHLELHRLALGGRHRRAHRLLRPLRRCGRARSRSCARRPPRRSPPSCSSPCPLAAARRHRMRGADVGGGRHGRHVRGHRDEDARGGGAGARRAPRRRSRGCRVQDALHHRAHRALEPARRIEHDDQGLGALGPRALDRGGEEADGDRGDGAVELDQRHGRRRSQAAEPERPTASTATAASPTRMPSDPASWALPRGDHSTHATPPGSRGPPSGPNRVD